MLYSLLPAVLLFLVAGAIPSVVQRGDDTQPKICTNLPVKGGGCFRYVQGFDITGVTTEIDLGFPGIQSECECIKACLTSPGTCNNYVWKFTNASTVMSGHRACTLYSNFNLPPSVTIKYAAKSKKNVNIQPLAPSNNPQVGGLAPKAFKDVNLDQTPDPDAISGPVWQLADGSFVC